MQTTDDSRESAKGHAAVGRTDGDKFLLPGAYTDDIHDEGDEDDEDREEGGYDHFEVYDTELNVVAEIPEEIVLDIIGDADEFFDPSEWPTDKWEKYVWDDENPPFIYTRQGGE